MMVEYVCIAVPSVDLDTSLIHTDYIPRERVVRCRDCEHAYLDGTCCDWFYGGGLVPVEPDGFCSYGKGRDA